ncbi:SLCO3A [Lepeophtheirus salmonis]|uniref:SLCO3A n=1 Tax=Lepeophtheirus salmonis TaxID=72036 RepID=A0A7R8CPP5_LEPSM|nr:SLCO3A [Lepeophtheirus salmonis]CAF2886066.1 SLCO3A [Lepeophtheirus salmonis]
MFTGGIAIPGACIGIFFGGYILKRLQLRPKGAVQLVIFFNFLCLACYVMLFLFGCDNVKMAGTTSPYYSNVNKTEPFTINLTASCNFGCQCDMNDVQPVCGANGLTYFSPCHAGCTETGSRNNNYTDCACVVNTEEKYLSSPIRRGKSGNNFAEVTVIPVATAGPCYTQCGMILPFMVLLFFMTLVVAVTQMPVLMVVLRSVEEEEKAFALGIQFVIFRLFGYIPSPILFGNVIDSTCILWKSTCEGAAGGSCLMYDIEAFRYKYVGVCSAIKVCSVIIFLIDWWLIRNRQNMEEKSGEGLSVGEVVNSMISLDKLFEQEGPVWVKMADDDECIEKNPTVDETTLPLEHDMEVRKRHHQEEDQRHKIQME